MSKMCTLIELKDWLEKGGKVWHPDWDQDEWMVKNACGSFVDQDGMRVVLDAGLVLSDAWVKVEENPKRWKPSEEEYYYFIDDERKYGIGQYVWQNDQADDNLYNSYNCFKNRREAEQARDLWLAERELRSLADGGKVSIFYVPAFDGFTATSNTHYKSPYTFSADDKAREAIKQLGKDKLKLIYGVK